MISVHRDDFTTVGRPHKLNQFKVGIEKRCEPKGSARLQSGRHPSANPEVINNSVFSHFRGTRSGPFRMARKSSGGFNILS